LRGKLLVEVDHFKFNSSLAKSDEGVTREGEPSPIKLSLDKDGSEFGRRNLSSGPKSWRAVAERAKRKVESLSFSSTPRAGSNAFEKFFAPQLQSPHKKDGTEQNEKIVESDRPVYGKKPARQDRANRAIPKTWKTPGGGSADQKPSKRSTHLKRVGPNQNHIENNSMKFGKRGKPLISPKAGKKVPTSRDKSHRTTPGQRPGKRPIGKPKRMKSARRAVVPPVKDKPAANRSKSAAANKPMNNSQKSRKAERKKLPKVVGSRKRSSTSESRKSASTSSTRPKTKPKKGKTPFENAQELGVQAKQLEKNKRFGLAFETWSSAVDCLEKGLQNARTTREKRKLKEQIGKFTDNVRRCSKKRKIRREYKMKQAIQLAEQAKKEGRALPPLAAALEEAKRRDEMKNLNSSPIPMEEEKRYSSLSLEQVTTTELSDIIRIDSKKAEKNNEKEEVQAKALSTNIREEMKLKSTNKEDGSGQPINIASIQNTPVKKMYFRDIVGLEKVKFVLYESMILPMIRPEVFTGLRSAPKGVLLFGPKGSGKTSLGQALANEANIAIVHVSFRNIMTTSNPEESIKDAFISAREHERALIFLDELEVLADKESNEKQDEEDIRNVTRELYARLDNLFKGRRSHIFILSATRTPFLLSKQLTNRFEKKFLVSPCSERTRAGVISTLLKDQKHDLIQKDFISIGQKTEGFSRWDLVALARDAAMGSVRETGLNIVSIAASDIPAISMTHFESSIQCIPPTYSEELVQRYMKWNEKSGSKIDFKPGPVFSVLQSKPDKEFSTEKTAVLAAASSLK